jgi:hypothetical protein
LYWLWGDPQSLQNLQRQIDGMWARIRRLEHTTMTTAQDSIDRAVAAAALIKAEFASLREQLAAEERDDQAQVDAAVAAARNADMDRIDALTATLTELLPGEPPAVDTPAPGEPATLPDGESSDDVVAAGPGTTVPF